jgi:hypothetical protein
MLPEPYPYPYVFSCTIRADLRRQGARFWRILELHLVRSLEHGGSVYTRRRLLEMAGRDMAAKAGRRFFSAMAVPSSFRK